MKKHYRHENDCLNCGAELQGKFCHVCGQENLQIKESFGHMMNHAISDYFHFDHQFFHTLKPLFLKPGMLTNEYMAGRRAQFLHPVKMYIFISLVYFVLVFKENKEADKVEHKQITTEHLKDSIDKTIAKDIDKDKSLSPAEKMKALQAVRHYTGFTVKRHLDKIKPTQSKAGDSARKAIDTADDDNDTDVYAPSSINTTSDTTYAEYLASQQKLPEAQRDGLLKRYYNKKAFALNNPKINKKELITEGIKHNFPKMMFLLLPLFALILKMTFWRNKKYYVEHLIYSFHLHSFVFLFLTFVMLIQLIMPASWHTIDEWLIFLSTIIILWYIYRSLRAVYNRSRWRTISKMIGMSFTYLIAFTICISLLVIITAATVV